MSEKDELSPQREILYSEMWRHQLEEREGEEEPEELTVVTRALKTIPKEVPLERDRRCLVVIVGNLTGKVFRLDQERAFLGRSSKAEICLREHEVSRFHASIHQMSDGRMLLQDRGSTNGTYVNGQRIQEHILCDGDRIQLGRSSILKYSLQDELEESFQLQLYRNATHDGLTQAHNRKYFNDRLVDEFSFVRRHHAPLSLLLLDIDHFKKVNDTYGHPMGDLVLQRVAWAIRSSLRQEDVFARYGGEEFAILARGIVPQQAQVLAERIRQVIERLCIPQSEWSQENLPTVSLDERREPPKKEGGIRVTVSIGVASTEELPALDSPLDLLRLADRRLLQAKQDGRNRVVL